jgi:EAL domain-containing protein (putative c-di-GMP-specific phosphodiesterase class I)
VKLFMQPIATIPERHVLHYEALVRLMPEDASEQATPAGVFMPMIEKFGLAPALDQLVVEAGFDKLRHQPPEYKVAINLSHYSIISEGFSGWLVDKLNAMPDLASRLIFEISEYSAIAKIDCVKPFIESVRSAGSAVTLDHFGRGFHSFAYLNSMKVDFVKIDGCYQKDIANNKDNQFLIQALADVAHTLDIRIIAKHVESEKDWQSLHDLGIDGAQGYFVGRPAA